METVVIPLFILIYYNIMYMQLLQELPYMAIHLTSSKRLAFLYFAYLAAVFALILSFGIYYRYQVYSTTAPHQQSSLV